MSKRPRGFGPIDTAETAFDHFMNADHEGDRKHFNNFDRRKGGKRLDHAEQQGENDMSTTAMRKAFDSGANGKGRCASVTMTARSPQIGGGCYASFLVAGKEQINVTFSAGANVVEESVKVGADWAAKQKD